MISFWYRVDTVKGNHAAAALVKLVSIRYYKIVPEADRIADLLERLGNLLRSAQREEAGQHGLQPVHATALAYLARANRYSNSPAAVTEFLGVTKGTASQTLLLLERKGLLERRPDAADRRSVRLALTPLGEDLAARTAVSAPLENVPKSGPEAKKLEQSLEDVLRGLQRARGLRSFGVCRTCRFFRRSAEGFQCGLTKEALSEEDGSRICREHEAAA